MNCGQPSTGTSTLHLSCALQGNTYTHMFQCRVGWGGAIPSEVNHSIAIIIMLPLSLEICVAKYPCCLSREKKHTIKILYYAPPCDPLPQIIL